MAVAVAMPRQGQSVETCVILEWHKKPGDPVAEGDVLFTYETDKASFEFESPASGTLLDVFFGPDQDIPVLTNVAAIGVQGESVDDLRPEAAGTANRADATKPAVVVAAPVVEQSIPVSASTGISGNGVSPRARKVAALKGVDVAAVTGTGPKGRVIERDVLSQAASSPPLTKAARSMASGEGITVPAQGTGIGGRVRAQDLAGPRPVAAGAPGAGQADEVTEVKLPQIRRIIGERMMQSLQQSAQLTLHTSANASALIAYRALVKANGEALGLANITINDLVAFALARTLTSFPELNALYDGGNIKRYRHVHLAVAVDTPRGLMVPVVRFADRLSLNELAKAVKEEAQACIAGSINPDLLSGGTITMSNLGSFGIEYFTPVINPPQVALLGVNTITQRPVQGRDGAVVLAPHIGLSLTIDHRAVDGAPGARFLQAMVKAIENINITLSL